MTALVIIYGLGGLPKTLVGVCHLITVPSLVASLLFLWYDAGLRLEGTEDVSLMMIDPLEVATSSGPVE